jgi:hypothetical protein
MTKNRNNLDRLLQAAHDIQCRKRALEVANSVIEKETIPFRVFRVIEQPLVLGALFLIGGLMGALLFTPAFILCALCILLGVHRAGALAGQSQKGQIASYLALALFLSIGGYLLYGELDKALERLQMTYAKRVADFLNRSTKEPRNPPMQAKLLDTPLELLSFNSSTNISVANNDPVPVYAIDIFMDLQNPRVSKTVRLGFDIEPGKVQEEKLKGDLGEYRALRGQAKTWNEHYQNVKERYEGCGMELVFFSPSDTSFIQIKNHYAISGPPLMFVDANAIFHYRVAGIAETKTQVVPVVALTAVRPECLKP